MPILVSFSATSSTSAANVDRFPEACPRCHVSFVPHFVAATTRAGNARQICFQCTSEDCRALFLATYIEDGRNFCLSECEPTRAKRRTLSDEILRLSPAFAETYEQSLAAEDGHLDQLSHLGLRRALQFLIRDFCKLCHPDETSRIDGMTVAECIELYVPDPNVKLCAARVTCLNGREDFRNMEWGEREAGQLKNLLRVAVNFIESAIVATRYP